jgi:hypothetical protein
MYLVTELELLASIRPQSLDTSRVEDMVKDYFAKLDTVSLKNWILVQMSASATYERECHCA